MLSVGRTLLLTLLTGVVLSLFASTYNGAYDDLRLRFYDLHDEQPYGKITDPAQHTATPLWTDLLAMVVPEGNSVRVVNALVITLCYLLLLYPRRRGWWIALLPVAYGGIANGSYEAWVALIAIASVRFLPVLGQALVFMPLVCLLLWDNTAASWDVANVHAVFGGLRQPLTLSRFALGLLTWLTAMAVMWRVAKSNPWLDGYTRAAVFVLTTTLLMPGMVRGIEWIAVALLWFGWQQHGRGWKPMLLLSMVIFLDQYGLRSFFAVLSQVPGSMTWDTPATKPALLLSFLTKVGIVVWLVREKRPASGASGIAAAWREYLLLPMRRWRPAYALRCLLFLSGLANHLRDLGPRSFPLTSIIGDGKVEVRLPTGVTVQHMWYAMTTGGKGVVIECHG